MDRRVARIQKLMAKVDYEQEFSEEIEDETIIDAVSLQLELLEKNGETENIKMLATIFLDDITQNILTCPVCGIDLRLRGAEIVSLYGDLHPDLSFSIYHLARWVRGLNIGILFEEWGYTMEDVDRAIRDKKEYPPIRKNMKKLREIISKETIPTLHQSREIILNKLYAIEQGPEHEDEKTLVTIYRKYLEDTQRLKMVERRNKQFG